MLPKCLAKMLCLFCTLYSNWGGGLFHGTPRAQGERGMGKVGERRGEVRGGVGSRGDSRISTEEAQRRGEWEEWGEELQGVFTKHFFL